jgi:hypothetical protein
MPTNHARRPRHRRATTLHLTAAERDLLLVHEGPPGNFAEIFRAARTNGPLVCLDLEDDQLREFLRAFEHTANSAQNLVAMEPPGAYSTCASGIGRRSRRTSAAPPGTDTGCTRRCFIARSCR